MHCIYMKKGNWEVVVNCLILLSRPSLFIHCQNGVIMTICVVCVRVYVCMYVCNVRILYTSAESKQKKTGDK